MKQTTKANRKRKASKRTDKHTQTDTQTETQTKAPKHKQTAERVERTTLGQLSRQLLRLQRRNTDALNDMLPDRYDQRSEG